MENERKNFEDLKSIFKNELKENQIKNKNFQDFQICSINLNLKIIKEDINKENKKKINNENKKGDNNNECICEDIIAYPKGLLNFGLNCYMNSLLQCLFYIPQFRNYFIREKDNFREDQQVCKALSDVMMGLKNNNKKYYAACEFKEILGEKNNLFSGLNACDAKDLYFNLIDLILNESLIKDDKDNLIVDKQNGFQLKEL